MKRFSEYLYRKSNIYLAIAATCVMIAYASQIMGSKSELITSELHDGDSLLGLKLGYGVEYARQLLSYLSTSALEQYSTLLLIWDNLFPFTYCAMYLLWLSLIYKIIKFKKPSWKLINLYPLLPFIADLIENYFERNLVESALNFTSLEENSILLASGLTVFKWSLSTLNYVIIIVGIIILIRTKIKNKI